MAKKQNIPLIRQSARYILKLVYDNGREVPIGLVFSFTFTVVQGQTAIYTVDSSFPQEIAQGVSPSIINGSISMYIPTGMDLIKLGLVAPASEYRTNNIPATSRYITLRLYDKFTGQFVCSILNCKISKWNTNVTAKSLVTSTFSFEGMYYESGIH